MLILDPQNIKKIRIWYVINVAYGEFGMCFYSLNPIYASNHFYFISNYSTVLQPGEMNNVLGLATIQSPASEYRRISPSQPTFSFTPALLFCTVLNNVRSTVFLYVYIKLELDLLRSPLHTCYLLLLGHHYYFLGMHNMPINIR